MQTTVQHHATTMYGCKGIPGNPKQAELLNTYFGETFLLPIGSVYGVFAYHCLENQPNVGEYTTHGSYGLCNNQESSN